MRRSAGRRHRRRAGALSQHFGRALPLGPPAEASKVLRFTRPMVARHMKNLKFVPGRLLACRARSTSSDVAVCVVWSSLS
jgi:hypothetical protein